MKDRDFRSFIIKERQRFIHYVRSLVKESTSMDAEDVVHDVFLKILERADLIPHMDNLTAYVYRSLKNRVIDLARTKKPTVSLEQEQSEDGARLIDLLQDWRPNALELIHTEQGKKQLFEALETLSEVERKVVIAHEFEGKSFKQLTEELNIRQNTLLSHKSRALRKLRKKLSNI